MSTADRESFDAIRRMHRILTMHFIEGMKQIDIATRTNLSVASVNRIIKQGRDLGMVEITIRSPFESAFDAARKLAERAGLAEVVAAPCPTLDDPSRLKAAGKAAASFLLDHLRDGQTICVTGGKGVSALVEALDTDQKFDVSVVPATGGVQGKHYTDVNHLASELALKLGGRAYQIHVPMFAASPQERDALMQVRSCIEALDRARNADVAVVGIGSIHAVDSSYFDLTSEASGDIAAIRESRAEAELLAHLLDGAGRVAPYALNRHLVCVTPDELARIPMTLGVAAGSAKVSPIISVLKGHYLKALATDEHTAVEIVGRLDQKDR
ncbi:Sorbitol operon regulator [Starkeya nomas]|uniref:Sorbitol operon regulator n=1 Tax=Starkeya nomas TaxID=2666134 RepID=A0A5S9PAK7_9HYPH|nr:Sorbitol operon regulator [Starkeya nomas]